MSPRIAMVSVPAGPAGVAATVAVAGALEAAGVCVQAATSETTRGRATSRAKCRMRPNVMLSSFCVFASLASSSYLSCTSPTFLGDRRSCGCAGRCHARVHETRDATKALDHVDVAIEERLPRGRYGIDPHAGDLGELALQRAQALGALVGRPRERELVEHIVADEIGEAVREVRLRPEVPRGERLDDGLWHVELGGAHPVLALARVALRRGRPEDPLCRRALRRTPRGVA